MPLPGHIEAAINAENTGQIAIGSDITQTQNIYNLKIGSVHGGVVYLVTPETMPRPQPRPVAALPRDFPGLLGRNGEVSEAMTALRAGNLVECFGETGIGKTVLLRHLAHRLDAQAFPDGIRYQSLGDRSYEDTLQALFALFYTTEIPFKPTPALIRQYVEGKQALLLFDDVALTRHEVERLMVEVAPACTFSLGSQKRHFAGEGTGIGLKGLPLDASLVLMQQTLGRDLTPEERPAAQHLHAALGGHPSRLIQMAARVQEEGASLAAVAQQVQTPAAADGVAVQDAEKRPEAERRMLALLALLGGKPIHAEHLSALAGGPGAEPALHTMAQQGLVERVGLSYRIAENLLQPLQAWDLPPMLEQALDYFATWAEQQRDTPEHVEWEADALMHLLGRAVEAERWKDVVRLGRALEGALALSGRWGAWKQVLRQYLQAAEAEEDEKARAYALHQMGTLALSLNNAAEAKTLLTEAVHLRQALGDQVGAAVTQYHLDLLLLPPGPGGSEPPDPSPGLLETIKNASLALKGAVVGIPALIIGGFLILMFLQVKPPGDLSVGPPAAAAVSLSWVDRNDAGTPFVIERRTAADTYAVIARVEASTTAYHDTTLAPNTVYVYRVAALDGDEPVYSEERSVLTLPAAPVSLTARAPSATTMALVWRYAGPSQPLFSIERENDGVFEEIAEAVAGTTFTDQGLEANTRYRYQVRAFNNSGTSDSTAVVSALTLPAPPSDLTAENIRQTTLTLTWQDNSPNPSPFWVERRSGRGVFREVAVVDSGTVRYTDRGLASNTVYVYRVAAQSGDTIRVYSEEDTTLTLPAAPTNLAPGAITQTTVPLTWQDPNPNPAVVRIERREEGGAFEELTTVRAGTTAYMDERDLKSNTRYAYRMWATNATGSSDAIETGDVLTVPAAPSNLSATATSAGTVRLGWADNNPTPTISKIERHSGGAFQLIDTKSAGTTEHEDDRLASNTTFTYRVMSTNATGDSQPSNEVEVLTPPVTPTNPTVETVSETALKLTWGYPDTNAPAVKIMRRNESRVFDEVNTVPAGRTEFTDRGLAVNKSYDYRLQAINEADVSELSRQVSGWTLPAVPTNLIAGGPSETTITLRWRYPGDGNPPAFKVERLSGGAFIEIERPDMTTYTVRGLVSNERYTFQVRSWNPGGESRPSNQASGLTLPATPTRLTARATSSTTVALTWQDANPNPAAVRITRIDQSGRVEVVAEVGAGTTAFTDQNLRPGAAYAYRVQAFNESGASDYTGAQPVTTLLPQRLVAERIEFRIIERVRFAGTVEIRGVVKNVGGSASTGVQRARLYEGQRLVAEQQVSRLGPGQEVAVVYRRAWNTSSPSEGEFPPTYRLVLGGANETERSGGDINGAWSTARINEAF